MCIRDRPDGVLVLGDTNSCLSIIGAKRLHIPIFHMEAGNHCKDECLPEETNRRIVDIISDVNMAYSEQMCIRDRGYSVSVYANSEDEVKKRAVLRRSQEIMKKRLPSPCLLYTSPRQIPKVGISCVRVYLMATNLPSIPR